MNKKDTLLRCSGYLLTTLAILFFIKVFCQYDYAYAEQLRMFRYSTEYFHTLLSHFSGIFTLVSDYLTQFYYLSWGGPLVNILYFILVAFLVDRIFSLLKLSYIAPFFAVSAGIYVLIKETDLTYQTESTLKLILALGILTLTLLVISKTVLSQWLERLKRPKDSIRYGLTVASFVLALFLGLQSFARNHYPQSTRLKVLEVMRWNQDWDGILSLPYMTTSPAPLYACYQNLALAQKGLLAEKFSAYPQMGEGGLAPDSHGLQHEMMLLSDIFYVQGNVAEAQMHAFNAMIYMERLATPTLILRLIETNLIIGNHAVAEKYIKILEETKFYAEKASSYRRFLHHDELVAADKDLGPLRAITTSLDGLSSNMLADLKQIVEKNPDFQPAKDYLNCITSLTQN